MYNGLYTGLQLDEVIKVISKKKFKKNSIEAERMLPPRSVIISDIIENRRDHYVLELYFNHSSSGISHFKKIEMLDDGRVILHLEDQESKLIYIVICSSLHIRNTNNYK